MSEGSQSFWEKLIPDTWPEIFFWLFILMALLGVADAFFIDVDIYGHVWRFIHGFVLDMTGLIKEAKDSI